VATIAQGIGGWVREPSTPWTGVRPDDARAAPTSDEHWDGLVLANLPGIGDRGFRLAIDHFGSPTAALRVPSALRAHVPRASVGKAQRRQAETAARGQLERTRALGLHLWHYGGSGYPSRLKALHDPPAFLWGRGDASWLACPPGCAIVGSRRATPYGLRTARALGSELSTAGIVVVSGMALGIDGAAHRGALDASGGTVAVLGSGVDDPTPRSQRALYLKILEAGLVVSEFPPGTPAAPHNFPRRNRIIAALSASVVVVEAARRSGALITVDHALDLGVTIYAVPGPIDTPRSYGPNALLADGASVVLSPQGLVESLGGEEFRGRRVQAGPTFGGVADDVWALLEGGPMSVDEIVSAVRKATSEVLSALGVLELEGWIEVHPGGRYARKLERRR
jgi:DNA processing protein